MISRVGLQLSTLFLITFLVMILTPSNKYLLEKIFGHGSKGWHCQ